jgi:hypothetical protein
VVVKNLSDLPTVVHVSMHSKARLQQEGED